MAPATSQPSFEDELSHPRKQPSEADKTCVYGYQTLFCSRLFSVVTQQTCKVQAVLFYFFGWIMRNREMHRLLTQGHVLAQAEGGFKFRVMWPPKGGAPRLLYHLNPQTLNWETLGKLIHWWTRADKQYNLSLKLEEAEKAKKKTFLWKRELEREAIVWF